MGDVRIGEGSSIWHGAVVRGDLVKIVIGKNTVIQDLTVLGTDSGLRKEVKGREKELQREGEGMLLIKDNVVIGPQCSVGAARVESYAYVADNAVVSDGCVIEEYAVLAGGSFLQPCQTVPSSQVWAGNPAKYLRDVTIEEKIAMVENAKQLLELSKIYAEETEKTPREVFIDKYEYLCKSNTDRMEIIAKQMWMKGYPYTHEDEEYLEYRLPTPTNVNAQGAGDILVTSPTFNQAFDKDYNEKSWEPLTFEMDKMSSVLKQYGVNTDMYEKAYRRFKNEPKGLEREDEDIDEVFPKDQGPWENKYDNSKRKVPPTIS
eukprot:TRINITY_DN3408_c0_g5_i1.p1 TRINITY_DN3408_c0_g5~~TRINITY_DN3408_c0_g5_i1.p1  ORF type:complete len:318 (+),score=102.07 TRINITY_DN3408_c0_g5_i1:323-1276(+)